MVVGRLVLVGRLIFRGYVKLREGIPKFHILETMHPISPPKWFRNIRLKQTAMVEDHFGYVAGYYMSYFVMNGVMNGWTYMGFTGVIQNFILLITGFGWFSLKILLWKWRDSQASSRKVRFPEKKSRAPVLLFRDAQLGMICTTQLCGDYPKPWHFWGSPFSKQPVFCWLGKSGRIFFVAKKWGK